MTTYTKSTNFATKDTLTSGDPLKIVKGTEINTEFDNIATAVNSKSNTDSPIFTGTVTIPILSVTGAGTFGSTITYGGVTLSAAVTGTGKMVLDTSPTLITPALGTPSALVGTNITGTASGLTAGNVTTNANLTGAVTSVGNATSLGSFTSAQLSTALTDETGSGSSVFSISPILVTPILGTPQSGTVTNLTGTASININGTVGATTANTGAFTTLSATGVTTVQAGTALLPAITTSGDTNTGIFFPSADTIAFAEGGAEAMRIDSSGTLLIAKTSGNDSVAGIVFGNGSGDRVFTVATSASWGVMINRQDNDGTLINFRQNNTDEGNISVSGTTVSYNGGHLSRWAQMLGEKDTSIVKGTVMSNLDEMNIYLDADGNLVDNEQLNKVKISEVEGDINVAGVFVNWTHDETHNVDEINMAMTGDMIIRIAQGTTVVRGDLLMSAGNGTAKPQGDDICKSKTIAKVTSTHVSCTYSDGSYCVPCVLMAC